MEVAHRAIIPLKPKTGLNEFRTQHFLAGAATAMMRSLFRSLFSRAT